MDLQLFYDGLAGVDTRLHSLPDLRRTARRGVFSWHCVYALSYRLLLFDATHVSARVLLKIDLFPGPLLPGLREMLRPGCVRREHSDDPVRPLQQMDTH